MNCTFKIRFCVVPAFSAKSPESNASFNTLPAFVDFFKQTIDGCILCNSNHTDERMQGTNWLEEKSTILKSIKAKEERLKDYEKVSNAINMLLGKYL